MRGRKCKGCSQATTWVHIVHLYFNPYMHMHTSCTLTSICEHLCIYTYTYKHACIPIYICTLHVPGSTLVCAGSGTAGRAAARVVRAPGAPIARQCPCTPLEPAHCSQRVCGTQKLASVWMQACSCIPLKACVCALGPCAELCERGKIDAPGRVCCQLPRLVHKQQQQHHHYQHHHLQ